MPGPKLKEPREKTKAEPKASSPARGGLKIPLPKDVQEKMLDYIKSKGQALKGEIAEALGIPSRTVARYLQKFVGSGRLETVGANKNTAYRIKEK
jgi:predicted HTH transcriptional regulator